MLASSPRLVPPCARLRRLKPCGRAPIAPPLPPTARSRCCSISHMATALSRGGSCGSRPLLCQVLRVVASWVSWVYSRGRCPEHACKHNAHSNGSWLLARSALLMTSQRACRYMRVGAMLTVQPGVRLVAHAKTASA